MREEIPYAWSTYVEQFTRSNEGGVSRMASDYSQALQILLDVWLKGAEAPECLPGDAQQQAALASLLEAMRATQRFTLALSRGDLAQALGVRGVMAGSLKSLQASLRHLTWQAGRIAQGDFNQRVEFMGEFSQSFNTMVSSLAEAREQIREQNAELARINTSLVSEIEERRQMEEALRESEEQFRRLVESMDDWVFRADQEMRYRGVYGSMKLPGPMARLSAQDFIGKTPTEVYGEQIGAIHEQAEQMALGGTTVIYEWSLRLGEKEVQFQTRLSPLRGPDGTANGLVGLNRDITELKRSEEERRQVSARAEIRKRLMEQREQERVQIARDLHDGPLQELIALTFQLEGMIHASGDGRARRQLVEMKDLVRGLVSELREFAGELRMPAISRFGLKETMQLHAETFLEKHPELHIELALDIQENLLPEAIGLAFYRIYQEVLNNVVQHARARVIKIYFCNDADGVEMQIADDGQGFTVPDDWLELARQGHLGLVGMRERAEAVGGKMEVWSKAGEGTKIKVAIKLAEK